MYEATGRERLVPIDPPLPVADPGDPQVCVVATDMDTLIAYGVAGREAYLIEESEREPNVAVVRFSSSRALYFGSPNDEALNGHPLYELGLTHTFAEVKNSGWIETLERRNRVHERHDPSRFETLRHFVLPFHDDTLECVARGVQSELVVAEYPGLALRDYW